MTLDMMTLLIMVLNIMILSEETLNTMTMSTALSIMTLSITLHSITLKTILRLKTPRNIMTRLPRKKNILPSVAIQLNMLIVVMMSVVKMTVTAPIVALLFFKRFGIGQPIYHDIP
jgi:hypothetical protein